MQLQAAVLYLFSHPERCAGSTDRNDRKEIPIQPSSSPSGFLSSKTVFLCVPYKYQNRKGPASRGAFQAIVGFRIAQSN
jgi:hypothetical protein